MAKNYSLMYEGRKGYCSNNLRPKYIALLILCAFFVPESLISAESTEAFSFLNPYEVNQDPQQVPTVVTGTVTDEDGEPIPGVSIVLKSNKRRGGVSNVSGKYTFANLKPGDQLIFSFIGMEPVEVAIKQGRTVYNVTMKYSAHQLADVVVEAGIIQRDKLGFTGSYSSVTQDELKSMGNISIIQSLKSLDPSFNIAENISAGSNPNALANIEIRGQTSMSVSALQEEAQTSSNTPLIIIDGFESALATFNDLDINRVASVTILKDAGSTAIYGSKGANGVIVVETVKPERGAIMIRYNSDIQLSFPDLGVYNLMNAAEKLEFERLAERWNALNDTTGITTQSEYYRRRALVESGVDTYWLSEPVRNAITHNHSFSVSGGDNFLFDAGVNYRNNSGVMKDTGRETFGGNVKLMYRGIKGFNISNNVIISGVNANEGAWGSFSDFARATPYFKKRNDDGSIPRYLDSYTTAATTTTPSATEYAVNPLYNATLNSYEYDRTFSFTNNTNIDWFITEKFRVNGALSLKKSSRDYQRFKDPRHTGYTNMVYTKKGDYTGTKRNDWSVDGNISAAYSHTLADAHNFTLITRGAIKESNYRVETYKAQGFFEGSKGIPSDAYAYNEGESPLYSESKKREVTFLAAFNYNYLLRYLFDFNYNIDGSTAFGSNKRFKDFWSVGLGWNLHKEPFTQTWKWLTELKLSGTIGINANQNQDLLTSSIYSFYSGNTQFGQGAYMSQFANPDLEWQKTKKKGASLDAGFLNNRLKVVFSVYDHHTEPLVATISQRPSSGTGTYPINMGYMDTKGIEFNVLYYPIYNIRENILFSVRVMGSHNTSKYGGYGEALANLNNYYLSNANSTNLLSIQKFEDGRSPSDIWAVRSLGIDPATGREVFLSKNGEQVIRYNTEDRVVVGNTKPDLIGTVSFNLVWKKLQINTAFRYSLGGDILNTALYNKVENISSSDIIYNLDKRALYDRWQKAGDKASFVAINQVKNGNPLSSRFVQRENYLTLENAKITWDFSKDEWIKAIRLKEFKVGFSMNDIFRLSTVKSERGIDYPFARSVIFNITSRF